MIYSLIFLAFVAFVLLIGIIYTRKHDVAIRSAFPAQGHFTRVTGGEIHWTKNGAGPAIVLVHGLAGNTHNFRELEQRLSKKYTVYALDRPGSGHSKRSINTDPSFNHQGRMIVDWMQAIGLDKAIFVGHSMGGAISLNIAIQAPNKVAGLLLICPLTAPLNLKVSPIGKWFFKSHSFRFLLSKSASPFILKKMRDKQIKAIFKPEPPHPDFSAKYGGSLSSLSSAFYAAGNDLSRAQTSLHEQIKRYHEINCPVHVLFGAGDRVLPCDIHTNAISSTISHAKVNILENRGHMLPITVPEECAKAVDSITNL